MVHQTLALMFALLLLGPAAFARQDAPQTPAKEAAISRVASAIERGAELILDMQEGETNAEWPYEGVYRVQRQIPIGYRVGGTAICAAALLLSPRFDDDEATQSAVSRAATFIIDSLGHPLMNPQYDGGYDVRGWGYTYALDFLLKYRARTASDSTPEDTAALDSAIRAFIEAIERTEIPGVGGWAYARSAGPDLTAAPSPFMTAPTLLALYSAADSDFAVSPEIIGRALSALTLARTPSGSYVYSGAAGSRTRDAIPGAVGRMVAAECALYLAGRSSQSNLRGSIDAFITHWEWLDKRRAKPGTHEPPYGVAPYYFYFAHHYAAMAVELLPRSERAEYRRRIDELLFSVQQEDGSWNDRIFARSANFGTAMAMASLMMRDLPAPAGWQPARAHAEPAPSPDSASSAPGKR